MSLDKVLPMSVLTEDASPYGVTGAFCHAQRTASLTSRAAAGMRKGNPPLADCPGLQENRGGKSL